MSLDSRVQSLTEVTGQESSEWCSYSDYKAGPFPDAPPIPNHWKNLPNLVLFDERNERGYDDLPVYSVTQDRGVVLQESLEYSVAEASKDRSNYKLIRQGDLVYNKMRMWQGAVGRASAQGVVSPAYVVLEPKENVDSRFFAYFYRSSAGLVQSNRLSYGIVDDQNSLRASDFLGGRSPVPPPQEQVTIADYLDKKTGLVDRLIDKKEHLIELLEERRTALITKAVTKGLDPDVSMKDSGEEWIGHIPEKWDTVKIRWVARMESGHTPTRSNEENWGDDGFPWVSLGDSKRLRKVDYILDTKRRITEEGLENSSARILPSGTVVFSRDATVGLCAITTEPSAVSQHFVAWICGDQILPEFLLAAIKAMKPELERLTAGATISTIGLPEISGLTIPLPPLDEQRRIVESLSNDLSRIEKSSDLSNSAIDLLQEYRSSLITAAVTGKIDVRDQAA